MQTEPDTSPLPFCELKPHFTGGGSGSWMAEPTLPDLVPRPRATCPPCVLEPLTDAGSMLCWTVLRSVWLGLRNPRRSPAARTRLCRPLRADLEGRARVPPTSLEGRGKGRREGGRERTGWESGARDSGGPEGSSLCTCVRSTPTPHLKRESQITLFCGNLCLAREAAHLVR